MIEMNPAMQPGILVIGIGNPDRRDDGAGLAVARMIRNGHTVAVVEKTGDPLELIELWDGAQLAIVVDAVSSGRPPGTVIRIDTARSALPDKVHSTHGLGLQAAIELAREIGRLPDRLIVFAIEGHDFSCGCGFSEKVSAGIETCARRVAKEIHLAGLDIARMMKIESEMEEIQ